MICPLDRHGTQYLVCIDKNKDGTLGVDTVMKVEYSRLEEIKGVSGSDDNRSWGSFKREIVMKTNPKEMKGNHKEIHVNNSTGSFIGGGEWIVRD